MPEASHVNVLASFGALARRHRHRWRRGTACTLTGGSRCACVLGLQARWPPGSLKPPRKASGASRRRSKLNLDQAHLQVVVPDTQSRRNGTRFTRSLPLHAPLPAIATHRPVGTVLPSLACQESYEVQDALEAAKAAHTGVATVLERAWDEKGWTDPETKFAKRATTRAARNSGTLSKRVKDGLVPSSAVFAVCHHSSVAEHQQFQLERQSLVASHPHLQPCQNRKSWRSEVRETTVPPPQLSWKRRAVSSNRTGMLIKLPKDTCPQLDVGPPRQ